MGRDLLKQSMSIIAQGSKDFGAEYASNLTSLVHDAQTIRANVSKSASTVGETLARIKSRGLSKYASDWFYQRESDTADFDMGDDYDEFDSGNIMDGSDDDDSSESTSNLNAKEMRDITKGQMNAIYGSAGRMSEVNTANTAEIVTAINDRSSEVVASINNVNKTLSHISTQFDTFMKYHASVQQAIQAEKYKESAGYGQGNSIIDSSGKLSLANIYDNTRNSIKDQTGILSMAKMMLTTTTPSDVVKELLTKVASSVKVPGTDKSVDDIGKGLNQAFGSFTQNFFAEMVSSKWFTNLFGDMTRDKANPNYKANVVNSYTTQPAVFDGMTRMSIINVIPEYLKKINESLSGQSWSVSNTGQLVRGAAPNGFKQVADKSFQTSGMNYDTQNEITSEAKAIDVNISQSDIDTAGRALVSAYVMYLHDHGVTMLRSSQLSTNDVKTLKAAVKTLKFATGKSDSYWTPICMAILQRLSMNRIEADTFAQNVNTSLKSMKESTVEYAMTSPFAYRDTGYITHGMVNEQFKKQYDYTHDIPSETKNKTTLLDSQIGNKDQGLSFTSDDYIRGTFDILNRGINVRVTNDVTKDTSGFQSYHLSKSKTPTIGQTITNSIKDEYDPDSDTPYLDRISNALIPKGIRNSMQFFGNIFGTAKGAVGEIKDKFNEKAADENSLVYSIKNLTTPVTDKISEITGKANTALFGNKISDSEGNTYRRGGLVDNVKNKASDLVSQAKDAVKSGIDDHVTKRDYKKLVKEVDINKSGEISVADQLAAQNVFALMQSSITDGETESDIGPIMSAIGNIKDEGLRSRVSDSVMGMLNRSGSKDTGKKSILSKVWTIGLVVLKKVFSPIITVVKTVVTAIKTIGGNILKFLGRMIKDGAITTGVGLKSMGQAMFGQREKKDKNGNITQEKSKGLIQQLVIDPDTAVFKTAAKYITTVTKKTAALYKKAVDGLTHAFTNKNGIFRKVFGSIATNVKKLFGANKGTTKDKPDGYSGKSEFLKGFTGVFAEARDAKEKSRIKKLEIETVADRDTNKMLDMVSGKEKSLLSEIHDRIKNIFDTIGGDKNKTENDTTGETSDDNADEKRNGITSTPGGVAVDAVGTPASDVVNNITSTPGGLADVIPDTTTGSTPIAKSGGGIKGTIKSAAGGIAGNLGKMLGGMAVSLGGLLQMAAGIVMGLEGFKALQQVSTKLLTKILTPLNKIFFTIIKLIQPILDVVGKQMTTIVSVVSDVLSRLIGSLMPLVQMLVDIINPIMEILKPIMEVLMSLVTVIMAPLLGVIQFVITPILRQVGNTLEIISGVLQLGMGIIMTALGGILTGIGAIAKIFGGGSGLMDSGKEMVSSGVSMTASGIKSIGSGTKKFIAGALDPFNITGVNDKEVEKKKDKKVTTKTESTSTPGSAMEGIVGSGDTYNNSNDNHSIITNIYGSGNTQGGYGSYMNMDRHGCGPMALADAYSRRTGKSVSPTRVAASMMGNGTYNPNRGTSVGGFIQAGQNAGMNLRAGRVTRQSLKTASPNNPITVAGSGPDFATRKGNIHYMNVVGSDKYGGVYVSNPMIGGVRRRQIDGVLSGSLMGLYGSGDSDDYPYKFDDSVMDAMSDLTSITDSLLGIFKNEKSVDDQINDSMNEERDKEAIKQARLSLTDEEFAAYEAKGYALFQKDYPKRDGETDAQYKARYEKVKDKYSTLVAKDDIAKKHKATYGGLNDAANEINEKSSAATSSAYEAGENMATYGDAGSSSSGSANGASYNGAGGEFVSDDGVKLGVTYKPTITKTDIDGTTSDKSILHEFFKNTAGVKSAYSWNYGWYNNGNTPDKDGKGSTGRYHQGVDIIYSNSGIKSGCEGGFPVISTVDGKVTAVYVPPSTAGNCVVLDDPAGNTHRFMHMRDRPKVKVGDKVEGGKTLFGYVGTTGASTCDHLHYDINKKNGGRINPHTFFKYVAPKTNTGMVGDKISLTSDLDSGDQNAFPLAVKKYGKDAIDLFIKTTKQAGMGGPEIATMISTGIWEDSGEKIFGLKSLEAITHDTGGQAAKGIMNWVDTDVDYGNTVLDQLKYIHNTYFDPNSSDSRSKIWNTGYYDMYKQVTGSSPKLNKNDRYGPYANDKDMLEGSAHFYGNPLAPPSFTNGTKEGVTKYLGTGAKAYNWMIDNGYITTKAEAAKNAISSASKSFAGKTKEALMSVLLKEKVASNMEDAAALIANTGLSDKALKNMTSSVFVKYVQSQIGGSSSDNDNRGSSGRAGRSGRNRSSGNNHIISESSSDNNNRDGSGRLFGSGDFDDPFPIQSSIGNMYNDEYGSFYGDDYMNNIYQKPNMNIINNEEPIIPSSESIFNAYSENTNPTFVTQKYLIKTDDSESREKLRAILTNTYKVRNERVESLLERILDKIDNNGSGSKKTPTRSNNAPLDLFDDNQGIPSQVSKLALG